MEFNSCLSVWLSGFLVSSAPPGLTPSRQVLETEPWVDRGRGSGREGDTRKDASRLFCAGVMTHKCDLRLFHVLPGAPAVVLFPASFQLQFSTLPTTSQALLRREGSASWLSTERSEQPLQELWEDPRSSAALPGAELSDSRGHRFPCVLGGFCPWECKCSECGPVSAHCCSGIRRWS